MFPRNHVGAALLLTVSLPLAACDQGSQPLELPDQEVSSQNVASGVPAPAGRTNYRFSLTGPYASLYSGSNQGEVHTEVSVDLYTVTDGEAFLSYAVWACSLTTFECVAVEEGYGSLYGNEVTSGKGSVTVSTNTADNPAFTVYAGSGGPVSLTWTELSGWSQRSHVQSHYRSPTGSAVTNAHYTTLPAVVEGSIVGVQLVPGSGYAHMGTVKEGSIIHDR